MSVLICFKIYKNFVKPQNVSLGGKFNDSFKLLSDLLLYNIILIYM